MTHFALSATWGHASSHITPVGLLAPPPQAWPLWSKGTPKILEASWPTGGMYAPTLPGVQGHQDDVGEERRCLTVQCS